MNCSDYLRESDKCRSTKTQWPDRGLSNSLNPLGAQRESAGTIVDNELKKHEREASAWRWLSAAMETHKPTEEEESALWDLLCRARRERY